MRHDFNSISQVNSFFPDDVASHITVLKPRDGPGVYAASDILSTFRNFSYHEKETWFHRVKLGFRILCFCLGPANIWRFPEQLFIYGNASYIYLYFIYMALFCTSLLVFELSLSQYFMKGFAKILTLCPLMEGITLAMVFYCIMANLVYNLIMIYSLIYTFTAVSKKMPHSFCSERLKEFGCEDKATNLSLTPENVYLDMFVEKFVDVAGGDKYNVRNAIAMVIVYGIMCVILIMGVFKYHWIPIIMGIFIVLTLLYAAIISSFMNGAIKGLAKMFVPKKNDLWQLTTWIYPFEQTIATIGVGTGPLTTIWSVSKIKYWSRFDCVIINVVAVLCSLFAAMILFSAAGVTAHKNNNTIEAVVVSSRKEIGTFVIVTRMFNTMPDGVGNFTLWVYYLMLFCSCFYSMLEYTHLILLYIGSYMTFKRFRRKIIILVCCLLCVFITSIDVTKLGFSLMMATNECFIATALLIILFFEFSSVVYFYGMDTFCDDIEFMLSYVPSYYLQFTWYILPALFLFFSIASVTLKFQRVKNKLEFVVLCLTVTLTLGPILGFAAYKCVVGIRNVGLRRFLNMRLNEEDFDDELPPSRSPRNTR